MPAFIRIRVELRHDLQKIISSSGWLFADKMVRLLFGLIIGTWVARYLGPDRIGQLSYAASFVLLFSAVSQLGLDSIVVRNLVHTPSSSNEILGSAFFLKLIGGVAAFGLILASIFYLRPHDSEAQRVVGITAIGTLFHAFSTVDLWYQSQVRSKQVTLARISSFLAISGVKVYLVTSHATIASFAMVGVADVVLGSIGLTVAYRVNGFRISAWRIDTAMVGTLLRDSWPLIFSDILVLIYMRIDKIMLGTMAGTTELGVYSIATYTIEILYFVPTIVTSSIFPSIVEAMGQGDELFYSRMQRLYSLMVFLAYSMAVPITLTAGWLIPFAFGARFERAVPMVIGLAWASTFIHLMIARSYFLTVMNWTRLHFAIDALGCLITVSLYYLLIPRYGAMGAVAASFLAYWFLTHGICFFYKPLFRTGTMMTKALLCPKFW